MKTYFELGFGAYLVNLTVGMFFFLLIVKLFDVFFSKKFSPGWRYVIAAAMAVFFLVPVRVSAPWNIIAIPSVNVPLDIISPDPVIVDGITDLRYYNTGAEAKGYFLYEYLFYIWITGAAVTLLYQVIRLAMFYRAVRKKGIPCGNAGYRERLSEICSEMKVKVPGLVIFPETDTPFAMGIFSPKIILPPEDFSEREIDYIFRHEVCHIKRADIFMKLFLIIFRCVNWFNPLAYILVKNAFADMEIACDERACKGFSDDRREEYSKTLLRGASKLKCPAVTTYLSPNARVIKKRIDAVMNVRKFGRAIPFTLAFAAVFMLSQTYYAMPDDIEYFGYVYTDPYPMEADPYITTDEWRTASGSTAAEAGEKIFRQYMEMYTGEDIPDYYRIEDYFIRDVVSFEENPEVFSDAVLAKGLLDPHKFVSIEYSLIPANKCGNTVHNCNFGFDLHLDGVYDSCYMDFELEKDGDSYTAVNMGLVFGFSTMPYHFSSNHTRSYLRAMAQSGLLDYSWNDTDSLPVPDDICSYIVQQWGVNDEYMSRIDPSYKPSNRTDSEIPLVMSYGSRVMIDENHIGTASCIETDDEGFRWIDPEKVKAPTSKDFEYCGFEIDLEDLSAVIYGNVTGDDPHGVKLYLYVADDEPGESWINRRLHRVEVTDELYTPVVYHDTFGNIPLPEGMTRAQEILEYMKIPRDGSDFTVIDYNGITEEADGTYANVCFKGRLDGIYSSDLKEHGDGYLKVKIT